MNVGRNIGVEPRAKKTKKAKASAIIPVGNALWRNLETPLGKTLCVIKVISHVLSVSTCVVFSK